MKVNQAHQKFILKLRGHNSELSSNTNLCTSNLYILVLSKCVSIQEKKYQTTSVLLIAYFFQ